MKLLKKNTVYKILISFFMVLLLVPNIGLFREQKNINHVAELENRTINPLPSSKLFSSSFFNELENWYNDRLLGRRDMIRNWAKWNGKIFNVLISKNVVRGKDGYLFSPVNMSTKMVDREQKLATIKRIQEQCAKRNIRFVFMLTPNSEMVLSDLFTEKYPRIDLAAVEKSIADDLDKLGVEHCFIGAEFSAMPLEDRKNMYYEGDYHWTRQGGYLASKKLLHQLGYANKIDSTEQKIDFEAEEGGYFRDAGLEPVKSKHIYPWSSKFVKEVYVTDSRDSQYTHGKMSDSYGDYGQRGEDIIINKEASNNRKILILGDSFAGAMKPYLIQDVQTIVFSHSRDIHKPKKNIDIEYMLDRYRPDAVVFPKMEAFFFWENQKETFGNIYFNSK